ncbi:MAG: hypothetical protein QOJ27_5 [Sphingomonadales bacterium]|nr:hypothetical protein [Sphingomonadales bacterium]
MTKHSGGATINRGPAPGPGRDRAGEAAGNAREKGEKPSPGDRERGETSTADGAAPVGLDTAHDRAS